MDADRRHGTPRSEDLLMAQQAVWAVFLACKSHKGDEEEYSGFVLHLRNTELGESVALKWWASLLFVLREELVPQGGGLQIHFWEMGWVKSFYGLAF